MLKNRVLRGEVLRPKTEPLKEGWTKLHSGELRVLYWPDIIRIVESVGMRQAAHVTRMGEN
jgi:hypothetical protein